MPKRKLVLIIFALLYLFLLPPSIKAELNFLKSERNPTSLINFNDYNISNLRQADVYRNSDKFKGIASLPNKTNNRYELVYTTSSNGYKWEKKKPYSQILSTFSHRQH